MSIYFSAAPDRDNIHDEETFYACDDDCGFEGNAPILEMRRSLYGEIRLTVECPRCAAIVRNLS